MTVLEVGSVSPREMKMKRNGVIKVETPESPADAVPRVVSTSRVLLL